MSVGETDAKICHFLASAIHLRQCEIRRTDTSTYMRNFVSVTRQHRVTDIKIGSRKIFGENSDMSLTCQSDPDVAIRRTADVSTDTSLTCQRRRVFGSAADVSSVTDTSVYDGSIVSSIEIVVCGGVADVWGDVSDVDSGNGRRFFWGLRVADPVSVDTTDMLRGRNISRGR